MKNISKALSDFHSKVKDIKKDSDNPYFKSKYAALDSILPAIKQPLADAGLTFTQIPVGVCKLKTIIIHIESGETIEGEYEMTPSKNDPQGQGSAITYMRRYALVSMLGLNTEDDDDGNEASKTAKPAEKTMTPKEAFENGKKAINGSVSLEQLNVVRKNISKSKNLSVEQKQELENYYYEKSETFDPTK